GERADVVGRVAAAGLTHLEIVPCRRDLAGAGEILPLFSAPSLHTADIERAPALVPRIRFRRGDAHSPVRDAIAIVDASVGHSNVLPALVEWVLVQVAELTVPQVLAETEIPFQHGQAAETAQPGGLRGNGLAGSRASVGDGHAGLVILSSVFGVQLL